MGKKLTLVTLALLLLAASNLKLNCRVTVNGREVEGLYSLSAVDDAATVAALAAEEILQGPAVMPEMRRAYCLSFVPPDGDSPTLTDALLCSVTGVKLADVAYVNGTRLGIVEDGEELRARLERFIGSQMPTTAVSGSISGQLQIQKLYSRTNRATNYDDMVLLVTGMAPVIYVDDTGKLV